MIDYSKIYFNDYDCCNIPAQFFFEYDLDCNELDNFLAYYIAEEDMPEDKEVLNIELCLNMYSRCDYKLEAILNMEDGTQEWIEIWQHVCEVDEFIEAIKRGKPGKSILAYAMYCNLYDRLEV